MIRCDHVTMAYGRQEVVRDACLEVRAGTLLPFVGPNGAGKTTLLRAILGLLKPVRGIIHTPFDKKPAGYLPQQKSIDPLYPVTTREIVAMGLYPEVGWWRRPSRAQCARLDEILERLGLTAHAGKHFGELSGGMKQKALLGRALVSGADVLIMDEPTAELDEDSEREVLGHLADLAYREGRCVLMAHHGLEQAGALSDKVCVVLYGRVQMASIEEARHLLGATSSARGLYHA